MTSQAWLPLNASNSILPGGKTKGDNNSSRIAPTFPLPAVEAMRQRDSYSTNFCWCKTILFTHCISVESADFNKLSSQFYVKTANILCRNLGCPPPTIGLSSCCCCFHDFLLSFVVPWWKFPLQSCRTRCQILYRDLRVTSKGFTSLPWQALPKCHIWILIWNPHWLNAS